MRLWVFYTGCLCLLFACSGPELQEPELLPKEEQQVGSNQDEKKQALEAAPKKPIAKAPTLPKYPILSNANCVAFLTQYGKENPENRVKMTTPFGEIVLKLYEDTPLHRANFVYLINRGYFKPVEMTRVMKDFVVQGGNSESPNPSMMRTLIGTYTIPAEFRWHHFHKKGALALSRTYDDEKEEVKLNPDKRSSPYDFYLVDGHKPGPLAIYRAEEARGRKYTDAQVDVYEKQGGNIHLDQEHTVFGEIVKGMAVLDKMASVRVDDAHWPRERLEITIELLED